MAKFPKLAVKNALKQADKKLAGSAITDPMTYTAGRPKLKAKGKNPIASFGQLKVAQKFKASRPSPKFAAKGRASK